MNDENRESGGAATCVPASDTTKTRGEESPTLVGLRVTIEGTGSGTVMAAQFAVVSRYYRPTCQYETREIWSLLVLLDHGEFVWRDATEVGAEGSP